MNDPRPQLDRTLREGVVFAERVMRSTADYYSSLLDAALEYGQKVWGTSLSTRPRGPATHAEAPEAAPSPGIDLSFANCTGMMQTREFVISNRRSVEVPVSFEMSEFISRDGQLRTAMPAQFEPAAFALAPGEERVVQCRLLPDGRLAANQPHMAIARVVGFPEMLVRLLVAPDSGAQNPA